ncbi:unnamed protein product [Cochlearia groenlandica]
METKDVVFGEAKAWSKAYELSAIQGPQIDSEEEVLMSLYSLMDRGKRLLNVQDSLRSYKQDCKAFYTDCTNMMMMVSMPRTYSTRGKELLMVGLSRTRPDPPKKFRCRLSNANVNASHLEESDQPNVVTLLASLISKVDTLTQSTNARFEALATQETPSQKPIRDFSPNVQRNLFGEPYVCPTQVAGQGHQNRTIFP